MNVLIDMKKGPSKHFINIDRFQIDKKYIEICFTFNVFRYNRNRIRNIIFEGVVPE